MVSVMTFAQERDFTTLKSLTFGIGLPFECRDLPGAGLTANIGYDATMEFYMGANTIDRQNFIRQNLRSAEELEDVNI